MHAGKGSSSSTVPAAIAPEQVDLNQVYTLIDGILPFEACLYYQILPLFIEGSRLVIGIVNPEDKAASDYVKKQLSYINYSLTFRTIQSDWHRDLLSKYLSHNAKIRQRQAANSTQPSEATVEQPPNQPLHDPGTQATFIVDQPDEISDFVHSASVRTPLPHAPEPELNESLETTLPTAPEEESLSLFVDSSEEHSAEAIVASPESLKEAPNIISEPFEDTEATPAMVSVSFEDLEEAPTIIASSESASSTVAEDAPTIISGFSATSPAIAAQQESNTVSKTVPSAEAPAKPKVASPSASSQMPSVNHAALSSDARSVLAEDEPPLHLVIDEEYRNLSESQLSMLPPKALMQALLGQVLGEGIGRLYFERPSHTGRILWSRDGVLQAVLESIEPQVFQGVINEFKLLTHLSLIAVKKPKQVEIERLYEGERILLRFRVMPNAYGEEATLQVLRGPALRFYQQQQIDKLGRDALDAAQMLSRRLKEIRDRARQSLNFKTTRSETLPAIVQLLKQMEAEIQELVAEQETANKNQTRRSNV